MDAWYFTFEYPPEVGGGLSTYMREVTDAYARGAFGHLTVFTLSNAQKGYMSLRHDGPHVTVVSLNPERFRERDALGHWVGVSRMFERVIDHTLARIEAGDLDLPRPKYIEFADGFAIGALSIQQKLCLNARTADIPILVNAHTPTSYIDRLNDMSIYALPNYATMKMELQAIAGADLVIGPSRAILDESTAELAQTGAKLGPNEALHNPFTLPPSPSEPAGEVVRDHFYMASRLTHWKGVENAIKALKILWDSGVDVPFHIFGDDTDFAVSGTRYSDYIKKRYGDYVERGLIVFKGKVPRAEIDASAATAYAQIHPSLFDNFPYSLLEAMSVGQVCVAGLNGGIKEIARHGVEMFLTDVKDAAQFADVLRRAMDLSAPERVEMGRKARAAVEKHCDPDSYFARKDAMVQALGAPRCASGVFPFVAGPEPRGVMPAQAAVDGLQLSVVVPYFNMGAFIDETIASIMASSVAKAGGLEIVLINDGSTEPASLDRLDALHADHGLDEDTLRIINIPNGGVAGARNRGIAEARAPFISLLDADDLVATQYYEKAIRVLQAYENVSFCGAWIEDFNDEGRIRNWSTWNAEPPLQLIMNLTNCQSLVYKAEVAKADGAHDPDLRMFLDDWEGVLSLMAAGHRGVMIPEPLFYYRIREGSIFRSSHNLWDINFEKITRKHSGLYNAWGAEIAAFMNANGPSSYYHIPGMPSGLKS